MQDLLEARPGSIGSWLSLFMDSVSFHLTCIAWLNCLSNGVIAQVRKGRTCLTIRELRSMSRNHVIYFLWILHSSGIFKGWTPRCFVLSSYLGFGFYVGLVSLIVIVLNQVLTMTLRKSSSGFVKFLWNLPLSFSFQHFQKNYLEDWHMPRYFYSAL